MVDKDTKKLGRPIKAVKTLASGISLTNYYSDIKPFLFGTTSTETTTKKNLPGTGIHGKIYLNKIIPGLSKDITVNIQGPGVVKLQRADINNQELILDLESLDKKASDYIFPSDVVSILTSIGKLFLKGIKDVSYGADELKAVGLFSGISDLDLVKTWVNAETVKNRAGNDVIIFYEKDIFSSKGKIKALINAVVNAAIEYEADLRVMSRNGFIPEFELKNELTKDLIPKILANIDEYKDNVFKNTKQEFIEADKKLKDEIKRLIDNDSYFYDLLLSPNKAKKILKSFKDQDIYHKDDPKAFKLKKTSNGIGVLESKEYKVFEEETIKNFLNSHKNDLVSRFITPLLLVTTAAVSSTESEASDEATEGGDVEKIDVVEEESTGAFTITRDQLEERALNDLITRVFTKFIADINNDRFEPYKNGFFSNYRVADQRAKISDEIKDIVDLDSKFIETDDSELIKDGLYVDNIFDSQWYIEFLNEKSVRPAAFYNKLELKYLKILLDLLENSDNFSIQRADLNDKAGIDLSNIIIRRFIEQVNEDAFNKYKKSFFEINSIITQREQLFNDISKSTKEFTFSDDFISTDLFNWLYQNKMVKTSGFVNNIYQSDWYGKHININSVNSFLSNKGANYYSSLYNQHIIPIIDLLSEETDTSSKDTSSAKVIIPTISTPSGDIPPATPTDGSQRLTTEQTKKLQYESAWMYNRAVYELFTAHGIKESDIDPVLLSTLREDVYKFTAGMDKKDLDMMFASSSKRTAALLKFYPEFAGKRQSQIKEFHNDLIQNNGLDKLTPAQRKSLLSVSDEILNNKSFAQSVDLLQTSLNNATKTDIPHLNGNIKNIVDSMINEHGLNQEYFEFDGNKLKNIYKSDDKHDVIWEIQNLEESRLLIYFEIPTNIKLSDNDIERLRNSLIAFAKLRTSELTLHQQNVDIARGLNPLSEEEAEKLINKDLETEISHRASVTTTRKRIEEQGDGETVLGGIHDKRANNRRDKLKKQYKTFLPLWNGVLSPTEQRLVYDKLGLPYNKNLDKDSRLEFVPEAMALLGDLDSIKQVANNIDKFKKEEREQLIELSGIVIDQDRTQKFGVFIKTTYLYTDPSEIIIIASAMGIDEGMLIEDASLGEIYAQDSGDESYIDSSGRRVSGDRKKGRLRKRFDKSKIGKRFNKRFGKEALKKKAKEKLKKAMSKVAATKAAQAIEAAIAGTGIGTALAIASKIARKIGIKRLLQAAAGTAAIFISNTIYAMGSIGGFIGGVIGGLLGSLGGPLGAMVGTSVGANIGNFIIPTRLSNISNVINTNSANVAAGNAAVTAANQAAAVKAGLSLPAYMAFNSIAVMAPSVGMLFVFFVSIFTVFIIQSSFLTPIPGASDNRRESSLKSGVACFEFGPSGYNKIAGNPPETITSVEWDSNTIDIFEQGIAKISTNETYVDLLCADGPITTYRFPASSKYWGWVSNDEVIFYEGAFQGGIKRMEYILIHETGHLIDGRNPQIVSSYIQTLTEETCYTYPISDACTDGGPFDEEESFSEGLVLYVTANNFIGNHIWPRSEGAYPFKENYPAEYEWYKENVYGGEEY